MTGHKKSHALPNDLALEVVVKQPLAKRIQMADIARMAGVSIATVSRALSGSPLIQQETRQRVEELAKSLNYRVNASAASLRRKGITTVGVVMLDDLSRPLQTASDPFMMAMVACLADALAERGQDLLLARYGQNRMNQLPQLVETGRVSGLIVMGQWSWHEKLNAMARRGVPMAVWGAAVPGTLYAVVGSDNETGGYLATQHLVEQGCQRIAFLGDLQHPEAALRHQGYLRALREAGQIPRDIWQRPILFAAPDLTGIVDDWVAGGAVPDAVFASSDLAAMGLVRALSARGFGVPDDVRLVGFDDIALAAHVHPSLTTVRQSITAAGPALVQLLDDQLRGVSRTPAVLPTELIIRESSLPPGVSNVTFLQHG
jgi:DNA-binding LacI/PurR family transcriptional regulator